MIWRMGGLSAAFFVFTVPALSHVPEGAYPVLTVVFAGLLTAIVLTWGRVEVETAEPVVMDRRGLMLAAALSVIGLWYVAYGWVGEMLWNVYGADMLIVIREAAQRFLDGHNPYFTYRNTYDAPWDLVLPYGPVLWGPYVVPQILHVDLRVVTIIGELFVPACCAIAATVEAARGRVTFAVAWVVLLAAVVSSINARAFTLMGHTPVYWPLLPLVAALVTKKQWMLAACALGVLIVARSTMVALVPIVLMAVWVEDRSRVTTACAVLGFTVAALLAPFVLWDYHAIWEGMVTSYPRLMKGVVWLSPDRGVISTFGVTGWLLSRGRGDLVEWTQLAATTMTCAAAWLAIRRGARPLPWMGLALLAFSMTSLWPVYYIYYDVLLLLVSAAIAEALGPALRMRTWLTVLAAVLVLVAATMRGMTVVNPSIEIGSTTAQRALLQGFAMTEREGDRQVAWIVNPRATIALPRRSVARADIAIDCRPFVAAGQPPQVVTAIVNGRPLWTGQLNEGWQTMRVPAPSSVWRVGFNRLEILSSSVTSTGAAGAGDDPRPRVLAVSRIEVVPR